MLKAVIIAIGNELLGGACLNSNAAFISRKLREKGIEVKKHEVLPDDIAIMEEECLRALKAGELVITTGGLGPTVDDVTGKMFPGQGRLIKNKVGHAPGRIIEKNGGRLISLPGVPEEMRAMFEDAVLPLINTETKKSVAKIDLLMMPEERVDSLLQETGEIDVGIYPAHGRLRIVLSGDNPAAVKKMKSRIVNKFSDDVFESENGKIEEALHEELLKRKKSLSVAESCSGGGISAKITALSGSSAYFLGSVVSYSNAMKRDLLGVSEKILKEKGAVSSETVEEMARGLFKISSADYGLAVSGIAGPEGGSAKKPVGSVWIGIGCRNRDIRSFHFQFKGNRPVIVEFAINYALGLLLKRVKND